MVPALLFQKVLVSYKEMRGARLGLLLLGPPLRPETRRRLPPGRGAQMSQNLFKNHFLSNLRGNAGPEFWSKLIQIEASSLLGPPSGQHYVESCIFGGGPKFLKICSKIHFLSNLRGNAGPEFGSKLLQIESSSLLGPSFRPEIRRTLPLGFSWAALGLLLAAPGLLLAAPGLLHKPS